MRTSPRLVIRSVPPRLRRYLRDLWDFDFYRTRSARLGAERDVFWFDPRPDGYRCEYRTTDDRLWTFEVDCTELRRLANGQSSELEVEERRGGAGEVHVPLGLVRKMLTDLIDSRELQLRPDRNTVEHFQARQTLSADLRDWIQARADLAERDDQKEAVAELVAWLLERPELDDLYMSDLDIYWLLRRRVWDVRNELVVTAASDIEVVPQPTLAKSISDEAVSYPSPVAPKEPTASRFQFLGLDFSLFEAPVSEAASYAGRAFCCVEQKVVEHTFELGVGDYVRVRCEDCGEVNFLDVFDAQDERCRCCGRIVAFPCHPDDAIFAGYEAIQRGDVAMTKDTELGMISWREAERGLTHGASGLRSQPVDTVECDGGWRAATLDVQAMWELLRTPNFISWQGERWLFSRGRPMVYLGAWTQLDFIMHAEEGDGEALFREVVEGLPERDLWPAITADGPVSVYVFRCRETGELRANWDMS